MIFVDSSFFIAEAVPRDRRHAAAAALAQERSTERLLTSSLVLAETWTFFRRKTDHRFAIAWLDAVRSAGNLGVERVDAELESEAWAWLRVRDERKHSFVDATSFALMRRRRITQALAFDGDFAAAGFVELRPSRGGACTARCVQSASESRGFPPATATVLHEASSDVCEIQLLVPPLQAFESLVSRTCP